MKSIFLIVLLVIAGCSRSLSYNDPIGRLDAIASLEYLPGGPIFLNGPLQYAQTSEGTYSTYLLREFQVNGSNFIQLYATLNHNHGLLLRRGSVNGYDEKIVLDIDYDVSCSSFVRCDEYQTVGLFISEEELLSGLSDGLQVEFRNRNQLVFEIPASYIRDFQNLRTASRT